MSKIADRFWERMEEMYGAEWTNKHGMEPKELWIYMLESVDPKAIKHAIKECLQSNPRAPTMPEIAAYLKAFNRVIQNQEQFKALQGPELTEEDRRNARKAIKKASPTDIVGNRRTPVLPNESYFEFMEKLALAMNNGMTEKEFITERYKANGWTEKEEEVYQYRIASIGKATQLKPRFDLLSKT